MHTCPYFIRSSFKHPPLSTEFRSAPVPWRLLRCRGDLKKQSYVRVLLYSALNGSDKLRTLHRALNRSHLLGYKEDQTSGILLHLTSSSKIPFRLLINFLWKVAFFQIYLCRILSNYVSSSASYKTQDTQKFKITVCSKKAGNLEND